jgi:hypothetical protein
VSEKRLVPEQLPEINPDMLVFVDEVLQLNLSETGGIVSSPYGLELNLSDGLFCDSYGLSLTIEDSSLALSPSGLKVNCFDGLTTVPEGLTIRLAPIDSGLDFGGNGLKIKTASAGVLGGVKPPNSGAGKFLCENGAWLIPPGIGVALDPIGGIELGVDGLKLKTAFTGIMGGVMPDGNATHYLDGTGAWSPVVGGVGEWNLIAVDKYTDVPASTQQLTMSDTSDLVVGQALRYRIGGTDYYSIVDSITPNTNITITGAPFSGVLTDLYAGLREKSVQVDFFVQGIYNDNISTDLLLSHMGQYYKWFNGKAYLVGFSATHRQADLTVQAKINVSVSGNSISTNDANNGIQMSTASTWVPNPNVAINTANYAVARGSTVTVRCTSVGGGTLNALDLSLSCFFVLE